MQQRVDPEDPELEDAGRATGASRTARTPAERRWSSVVASMSHPRAPARSGPLSSSRRTSTAVHSESTTRATAMGPAQASAMAALPSPPAKTASMASGVTPARPMRSTTTDGTIVPKPARAASRVR